MANKLIIGAAGLVILVLGVLLPVGQESKTLIERLPDFGAAVNSPDLSIGAYRLTSGGMTPYQGTTTILCSIQAPAATSSLVHATVGVTSATSSATFLSINRSTAPYSTTTTALAITQIPANQTGFVSMASNTPIFPNQWLVFAQNGGTGILNQTGQCEALFAPVF